MRYFTFFTFQVKSSACFTRTARVSQSSTAACRDRVWQHSPRPGSGSQGPGFLTGSCVHSQGLGEPLLSSCSEVCGGPQSSCLKGVWVELRHVAWLPCMCPRHRTMRAGAGVQKEGERDSSWSGLSPNSAMCWMKKLSYLLLALYLKRTINHITTSTSNRA